MTKWESVDDGHALIAKRSRRGPCAWSAMRCIVASGTFRQRSPPHNSHARPWPTKPVRIVVPFGAGATPDVVARLIADDLQTRRLVAVHRREQARRERQYRHRCCGQGGAGRRHHRRQHRRPARHQHTVVRQSALRSEKGSHAHHHAGHAAERARGQCQPGRNRRRGADRSDRHNPGKYAYGSIGTGSLSHLAMEAIALKSGTQLVHVPYSSSPQAVTALIRNDVQMVCLPAISVMPQLSSGEIKILAVTHRRTLATAARHPDAEGGRHRRRGRRLERPHRAGRHSRRHGRAHPRAGRRGDRIAGRSAKNLRRN